MCLILQETVFQDQVLKPCEQAEEVPIFKTRQVASIELKMLFQPRGSTASRQIGIC